MLPGCGGGSGGCVHPAGKGRAHLWVRDNNIRAEVDTKAAIRLLAQQKLYQYTIGFAEILQWIEPEWGELSREVQRVFLRRPSGLRVARRVFGAAAMHFHGFSCHVEK